MFKKVLEFFKDTRPECHFQCYNFMETDNPLDWEYSFVRNQNVLCFEDDYVIMRCLNLLNELRYLKVKMDQEEKDKRMLLLLKIANEVAANQEGQSSERYL